MFRVKHYNVFTFEAPQILIKTAKVSPQRFLHEIYFPNLNNLCSNVSLKLLDRFL